MSHFNSSSSSESATDEPNSRQLESGRDSERAVSRNAARRSISNRSPQPALGYRWDATLLDRLQSQLTRFHD
jgi:hypothetical protein